jgi:biopolymer transport protein ExbD
VDETPEAEIDMTPMIDIVFLLIIFFMVVSDIAALDMEELTLPFADRATKPAENLDPIENPPLTINVPVGKSVDKEEFADNTVKISGRAYFIGKGDPLAGMMRLEEFLKIEAEAAAREDPPADNPGLRSSKLRVLVRADQDTQFKNVQAVFDACQKNSIYKTVLGANKDEPSDD